MGPDPNAILGVAFTLLLVLLIGGMILLYPLTRQLGKLIETKVRSNAPADGPGSEPALQAEQMRELIRDLQVEVGRLSERQEFFERLIADASSRQPEKLP